MSERVGMVLVGCGRAAERLYLPAFAAVGEARLAAVVDPSAARRALVARQVNRCEAFASLEEAVERTDARAVVVATPPESHVALAKQAVERGLGVLVEKPLAATMDGVDRLAELAAARRVATAVGFNRRFWRPVQRLRDAVLAWGGDEATAELTMSSDAAAWGALSGVPDPLDDLCSHQLDLLRFVFGRDVAGVSMRRRGELEVELDVALDGGVYARCVAAQGSVSQERIVVTLGERRLAARLGSEHVTPTTGAVRFVKDAWDGVWRRIGGAKSTHKRSYAMQLRAFVGLVRGGERGDLATLEDGVAVVRAVEAARRSGS